MVTDDKVPAQIYRPKDEVNEPAPEPKKEETKKAKDQEEILTETEKKQEEKRKKIIDSKKGYKMVKGRPKKQPAPMVVTVKKKE